MTHPERGGIVRMRQRSRWRCPVYALILSKDNGYIAIPATEPLEFIVTDTLSVRRADGSVHRIETDGQAPNVYFLDVVKPWLCTEHNTFNSPGTVAEVNGAPGKPAAPAPSNTSVPVPGMRVRFNDPGRPAHGTLGTISTANGDAIMVNWDDGVVSILPDASDFGVTILPA